MTPPVEPILLQIGSLSIHWYGVLVVTGILLGTQVASYLAKRAGEDPERIWDLLLVAVIFPLESIRAGISHLGTGMCDDAQIR